MVKPMNEVKNKWLSSADGDEALGSLLSSELVRQDTGECPGPADLADVVEGTASTELKERVLKHVSACESCYETFMLTTELHGEQQIDEVVEREQIFEKTPRRRYRWRNLALAASLMIVVFSLYVFYRSDEIPKTPAEFMAKTEALPETAEMKDEIAGEMEKRAQPPAPAKPTVTPVGKGRIEADDAAPRQEPVEEQTRRKKAGGRKMAAKQQSLADKALTVSKESAPIDQAAGLTEKFKRETQVGEDRPGESVPAGKRGDTKKMVLDAGKSKRQRPQPADTGQTKMTYQQAVAAPQAAAAQKKKMSKGPPELKSRAKGDAKRSEGVKSVTYKDRARQQPIPMPIQSQAVALNMIVQKEPSYLSQARLERLLKETITLSGQMRKEFVTVRTQALEMGDINQLEGYTQGIEPLISVRVVGEETFISPNIEWFYSKSAPSTLENRFFALARTGWCDTARNCFGAARRGAGNNLLQRWRRLQPQLTGIFKDVADQTITQLKVQQ